MVCWTKLKPRQTVSERKAEVIKAVERFERGLATGKVKATVGPQGAIAFRGLSEKDRDGVTDACAFRRIMTNGSASARQAIARAEMLAGRKIDKQVVGRGVHSHNGGVSWHDHKG